MSRLSLFAVTLLNAAYLVAAIRVMGIGIILGGDEDKYGCKPSTGYSWCNETLSCIPINQVCSVVQLD
jgi:hypothetical protein